MDMPSLAKSELLVDNKTKDASHNLLSDAIDFVKSHPVETAAGALAATVGVYHLSKLLLSSAAKNESSNLIRSAVSKGENVIEAHGDLGSHLHPDVAARLDMSAPVLKADLVKGTSSTFTLASTEELAGMSHALSENGLARITIVNIDGAAEKSAADFENALDLQAFGSRNIRKVKLPDDVDPIVALKERAAAISRLGDHLQSSSVIKISWGSPSTQALDSTALLKKLEK